MLHLIGTGLYYLNDLPFRAIELIKNCDEAFLERYTNLNDISFLDELEKTTNKKISIIKRETLESSFIVEKAKDKDIVILVPGDPLAATTHFSIIQDCIEKNIKFEIVHASSIFSALGETGLSLYKFGGTTSIPIYTENFKPESFFDVIEKNLSLNYHSLILLEVRDENTFLNAKDAVMIIKNIEEKRNKKIINWENVLVVSRLGGASQKIEKAIGKEIEKLKPPLVILIPGELSKNEEEAINLLLDNSRAM